MSIRQLTLRMDGRDDADPTKLKVRVLIEEMDWQSKLVHDPDGPIEAESPVEHR